jgi:hypothetical protein
MPLNLLQTLLLEFQAHLETKPVNHTVQLGDLASYVLTLTRLMSYMEHPFFMFLDHTQRRSTVGRTPLDE